jgi:RimJ/RimL family protein N-acetyltransferase
MLDARYSYLEKREVYIVKLCKKQNEPRISTDFHGFFYRGERREHSPMRATHIETKSLKLILKTKEEVLAMIEAMPPSERAELSADWLARIHASTCADPWTHGFSLVQRDSGAIVGTCGFKGPPAADGVVEIAYGINPDCRGRGYATEAAQALTAFAISSGKVRVVRAHTLPEQNASTKVLEKCSFQRIGEVNDPEDGLVWRWEKKIKK